MPHLCNPPALPILRRSAGGAIGRVAICLAVSLCFGLTGYAQHWQQLTLKGASPPARAHATSVYDSVDHKVVLFGGRSDNGLYSDVWALDLGDLAWSELTPTGGTAPSPRSTPAGVYDHDGRQMLVWSGQGDGFFNDVWAFDLVDKSWTELTATTDVEPSKRYGVAAVYDPASRDLVTFAGFTDQGRFEDTWRFDIENVAWSEIGVGAGSPGRRCRHSAMYDAARHRMVVYGGQRTGALGDIWALDLNNDTWMELTPPPPRPSGRYFATTAYDAENDRILLFGGNQGGQVLSDELWSFNFSDDTWHLLSPTGEVPSPREGAVAVYIPDERRMLVIGGRSSSYLNDVWSLEVGSISSGAVPEEVPPNGIQLHQNYPNPFAGETTIALDLSLAISVDVTIYDLLGREVQVLAHGPRAAGRHTMRWDARSLVPGTYVCRLSGTGVARHRLFVVVEQR